LALEDTERRLQTRLERALPDGAGPANLEFATEWPRVDAGGLQALERWLATHPATRLVAIDTLAKIRPAHRRRDGNLYDEDYAALTGLKTVADRFDISLAVAAHLRKLDAADPVDTVSAALGLAGAADAVLVLKLDRGQADATLFVTGRDLEEQELALRWDQELCAWAIL